MTDELPPWYPQANAPHDEVTAWLIAETPSYDEMGRALPWLDRQEQFDAWLEAARDLVTHPERADGIAKAFPRIAELPPPPRPIAALDSQ